MPDAPSTAILRGVIDNDDDDDVPRRSGSFELELVDYQFPEEQSGGNSNWLVVESTWSGPTVKIRHRGADIAADELDGLLRSIDAMLQGQTEFARSQFLEPNIQLDLHRFYRGDTEGFGMTLELHGEPAMLGEHFDVRMKVLRSDLERFHAALARQAEQFPVRPTREPEP